MTRAKRLPLEVDREMMQVRGVTMRGITGEDTLEHDHSHTLMGFRPAFKPLTG